MLSGWSTVGRCPSRSIPLPPNHTVAHIQVHGRDSKPPPVSCTVWLLACFACLTSYSSLTQLPSPQLSAAALSCLLPCHMPHSCHMHRSHQCCRTTRHQATRASPSGNLPSAPAAAAPSSSVRLSVQTQRARCAVTTRSALSSSYRDRWVPPSNYLTCVWHFLCVSNTVTGTV